MDRRQYVHKRKRRYMAQVLERFERDVEPHLPSTVTPQVDDFKALVRMRFNALAVDAADLMSSEQINGYALDLKDRIHPEGRPNRDPEG